MTQDLASFDLSDIASVAANAFTLSFIDDAEYEFVGGGTAVNSL